MKNKKFEKGWNWGWLILTGIFSIYNLITLIYALFHSNWKDVLIITILSSFIFLIFFTSLFRVLEERRESKNNPLVKISKVSSFQIS